MVFIWNSSIGKIRLRVNGFFMVEGEKGHRVTFLSDENILCRASHLPKLIKQFFYDPVFHYIQNVSPLEISQFELRVRIKRDNAM